MRWSVTANSSCMTCQKGSLPSLVSLPVRSWTSGMFSAAKLPRYQGHTQSYICGGPVPNRKGRHCGCPWLVSVWQRALVLVLGLVPSESRESIAELESPAVAVSHTLHVPIPLGACGPLYVQWSLSLWYCSEETLAQSSGRELGDMVVQDRSCTLHPGPEAETEPSLLWVFKNLRPSA